MSVSTVEREKMKKEINILGDELNDLFSQTGSNGSYDIYEVGEAIVEGNMDERILDVIAHAQWAIGELERLEKKQRIVYHNVEKDKLIDVMCGLGVYRSIQKKVTKGEAVVYIDDRTGLDNQDGLNALIQGL